MKWLFVTTKFPWPLTVGAWLRTCNMTAALRRYGEEVSLLSYEPDPEGADRYSEAGIKLLDGPTGVSPTKGPGRSLLAPYVYDKPLAAYIARHAAHYDLVVLMGIAALQYSYEASAANHVIADIADDPVLEESRKLWRDLRPMNWARRIRFLVGQRLYEKNCLGPVDLVTFVSEEDRQDFARRHADLRTALVPGGVDTAYFERPENEPSRPPSQPTLTFVGSMCHPPNQDAACYLINEIAPVVWKTHPHVRFRIAGHAPPPKVRALAGPKVEVTGYVDDIRPLLWQTTAVIAPMRIGTGVKNKILEAWAAGAAVAASPLACQGISAENERNILTGGSSQELARCAVRLIDDDSLRARIADHAHMTVRQHHGWSVVARGLRDEALQLASQRTEPLVETLLT